MAGPFANEWRRDRFIRKRLTCITGMVLSILSHFEYDDDRLDTIAAHLLQQQLPDGGWNCQRPYGATHASVHTTISVLEGLRLYELHRRRNLGAVRAAQARGREFLLVHRLFRSQRTGEIIKLSDDVIEREANQVVSLGRLTVFADVSGPLPDQFFEGLVHRGSRSVLDFLQ